VTLTITREVARRSDGKFRPTGQPWTLADTRRFSAVGTATRRTGSVKPGRLLAATASGDALLGARSPGRDAESAIDAESYLPAVVRMDLAALVPSSSVHIGQILLSTVGDRSTQEIAVLRLDDMRAVVVKASRPDKVVASWELIQCEYQLPTARELGARTSAADPMDQVRWI
jgi:hypothetical protein